MKSNRYGAVCRTAIVALLTSLPLPWGEMWAQSGPSDANLKNGGEFSELVVTSTRTCKLLRSLPVPTTVFSKSQIDRISPTSMKDILLYSIPGVELWEHGGILHISFQGYSAEYITFLINGEEVSGLKSGSIDLTRLSPENVERVEYVTGAGSALYGSSSVGGVINIITKDATAPHSLTASGGYTHRSQYTSYLGGGIKRDKWRALLNGSYDREGGYTIHNRDDSGSLFITPNSIWRVGGSVSYSPIEQLKLGMDNDWSSRIQYKDEYQNDRYNYLTNRLKAGYAISRSQQITFLYNQDYSWRDRLYPQAINKERSKDLIHRNIKNNARLQWDYLPGSGHELNAGIEWRRESLLSDQISGAKETKHTENGVLFAQDLWNMGGGFKTMYGGRLDWHSVYGFHFSPKVTLSYQGGPWGARLGYYHAFKSPSMMELYYDWSHQGMFMIIGNPDLKPERAYQWLVGVEYHNGSLDLSAGMTHSTFVDRIVRVTTEKMDQKHINLDGKRSMTSLALQGSWRILQGLTLNGSYLFTHDPSYYDVGSERVNVSTTRPHNLLLRLEGYKAVGDWNILGTLMGQWLSAIHSHTISAEEGQDGTTKRVAVPLTYEGYPMCRVTITGSYKGHYSLTLGVDNLLNFKPKTIANQTGSLSPGIVPFTRLTYNL